VRVLYLITELDPGGAERNLFRLLRHLKGRITPLVVSLQPGGEVARWLDSEGIGTASLDIESKTELYRLLRLPRVIRRFRPDLIHSFLHHGNLCARLLGRPFAPVVSSVRVAERERRWHLLTERLTWPLSDAIVCVSEGVKAHLMRSCKVPSRRLFVIPNCVDIESLEKVEPYPRDAMPAGGKLIVYVGRLTRQKGIRYLLEALALAPRGNMFDPRQSGNGGPRLPGIRLILIGKGEAECSLKALAARLGVADRVAFVGYRDDAVRWIKGADLLVLPSLWEGMPNVVLEAMALGTPVVATRVEGTREILSDGETGILVEPRDPRTLATAMTRVLSDQHLAARLVSAAREAVRQYGCSTMAARYVRLYETILDR